MNDRTTQTLQFGSVTIIVHRPVLTEQERTRRERQVTDAMASVMRDHMKKSGGGTGCRTTSPTIP